jgi:predicted PurR-regulated permease PerM
MTSKVLANGILRAAGILALSCLVLLTVYQISTVIIYLIIAAVFTLIAYPLVQFLKTKLKFNNTLAVASTLILFSLFFIGFILLFVPLILSQVDKLSLLDINSLKENYSIVLQQITDYLAKYNIDLSSVLENSSFSQNIDFNFIPNLINAIIGVLGSLSVGLLSVFFISFFFLKDRAYYFESFKSLLPKSNKEKIILSVRKSNELLSRYFIGLMLQLLIVFVLYYIVLSAFGIDNGFIIALLCAVLNIIPYIGPIIGIAIAAILSMISNLDSDFTSQIVPTTIYVVLGLLIVQLIDNLVNQPLIFSKSTNSHPLQIFIVILVAGSLFGITGMIIAVPTYTVLKVMAKEFFPNNTFVKLITKNH